MERSYNISDNINAPLFSSSADYYVTVNHARGSDTCAKIFTGIAVFLACAICLICGIITFVPLICSSVPAILLLVFLRWGYEKHISAALMTEFFWWGGILSITISVICECYAQLVVGGAFDNLSPLIKKDSNDNLKKDPPIWEEAEYVIFTTIGIGLVEEVFKFFILARIKSTMMEIPNGCGLWWRLVDSPYGIVLAGCASAAGFAVIENIQYIAAPSDVLEQLQNAVVRTISCVPIHVCATGYAASRMAHFCYSPPPANEEAVVNSVTSSPALYPASDSPTVHSLSLYAGKPRRPALSDYVRFLWFPVLLHGLYDAMVVISLVNVTRDHRILGIVIGCAAFTIPGICVVAFRHESSKILELPCMRQAQEGQWAEMMSQMAVHDSRSREAGNPDGIVAQSRIEGVPPWQPTLPV